MFKNQQGNAYSSVKILNEKKSGFRRAQWSCLSKLEIPQENISKGLPNPGGREESGSNFSHEKLSEGLYKPSHALVLMVEGGGGAGAEPQVGYPFRHPNFRLRDDSGP